MFAWNSPGILSRMSGSLHGVVCASPSLWPSGIGAHLWRNRLRVRVLAVSDTYPMFIEPMITPVPSGFSGYIWLDKWNTESVFDNLATELEVRQTPQLFEDDKTRNNRWEFKSTNRGHVLFDLLLLNDEMFELGDRHGQGRVDLTQIRGTQGRLLTQKPFVKNWTQRQIQL